MNPMRFLITEAFTGDPLWLINDETGPLIGIESIVDDFITAYSDDIQGWSLSFFDIITQSTAEIDTPIEEIPKITAYLYYLEHAFPLVFIGLNSWSDSIVVGMPLCKGRLQTGCYYKAVDGRLILQYNNEKG